MPLPPHPRTLYSPPRPRISVHPPTLRAMFERSLNDVVKGVRTCTPDQLPAFIAKVVAEVRKEERSADADIKANAVSKLCYLHLLGEDISDHAFHVVEVMALPKFAVCLWKGLPWCREQGASAAAAAVAGYSRWKLTDCTRCAPASSPLHLLSSRLVSPSISPFPSLSPPTLPHPVQNNSTSASATSPPRSRSRRTRPSRTS